VLIWFCLFAPQTGAILGVHLVGGASRSVATAVFFSLDLFFRFIWGSGVFIENLEFFDFGQILEMYVVLLYFPFKNTAVSQAQCAKSVASTVE